jgi:hypothetical protein
MDMHNRGIIRQATVFAGTAHYDYIKHLVCHSAHLPERCRVSSSRMDQDFDKRSYSRFTVYSTENPVAQTSAELYHHQ